MSLYGAMNIGVAGLAANSRALSATSSNIANVNTVGYKNQTAHFATFLNAQSAAGGASSAGVTSMIGQDVTTQGLPTATSSATDLSLSGNGFFVVASNPSATASQAFTRAGMIDATLSATAQAEAERLARDGGPKGRAYRDSSWRRPVWLDGTGGEHPRLTAQDQPGDWDPATDVQARAALIETNGAVRLALLHQDAGGEGPVLRRMGCGGALAADGRSRWWVVLLGP